MWRDGWMDMHMHKLDEDQDDDDEDGVDCTLENAQIACVKRLHA